MKLKKMALLILISGGILNGIYTDLAYAGAAYIYEMGNSTDTGYAGAGLAGRANDAGTVFTNPAGMTRIKKSTALVGLTPLYLYAPFNPDGNTTATGSDGDTTELLAGVNFAYIRPVTERLTLGISASRSRWWTKNSLTSRNFNNLLVFRCFYGHMDE